ncbi:MAG: hypothetical protein IKQ10_04860 [Oscillospiraceae bacterium]|nr:hypothetical protein [Oscillospiraceae bacterium]
MPGTEKKKTGRRALAWILVLIVAAALGGAGWLYSNYAFYDGQFLPRSTQVLDLRGKELTDREYEAAAAALPGAKVLRDVTIAGITYSSDETEIVTGDFTAAEIPEFSKFDVLRQVDATACTDPEAVAALSAALPDARVIWYVTLSGKMIFFEDRSVSVADITAEELAAALRRLPEVESVTVTDASLAPGEQLSLLEEFSGVRFRWIVNIFGEKVLWNTRSLDLSNKRLTRSMLGQLETWLPLLPELETIDFTGVRLTDAVLLDFAGRHPELFPIWKTQLFGVPFSTDAEELCFDDLELTAEDAERIEKYLPAMHSLRKVTMLRCGISNEDMETINLRHDDVQFVWYVQVYNYGVRTDQTYFTVYNCDYYYPEKNVFADNLRYCHDMIAIDLGHQHWYGYNRETGEYETAFMTGMPHLKYLVLGNCAHNTIPELAGLKDLVWLELFKTSFYDLTPLLECRNLRHLNIAFIRVKTEQQRRIDVDQLKQMVWLERLWIGGNMFSAAQVQELREALPDTEIKVMYGEDATLGGWRKAEEYFKMRDAMHMYYMNDTGGTVVYNPYTGERSQYEWTNPFR